MRETWFSASKVGDYRFLKRSGPPNASQSKIPSTTSTYNLKDNSDYLISSHNLGAGVSRKMANYIISVLRRARQVFGSFDLSIYSKPPITPEVLNADLFAEILFSKALLTNGEKVPNDRCCRICGKIGHFIKG